MPPGVVHQPVVQQLGSIDGRQPVGHIDKQAVEIMPPFHRVVVASVVWLGVEYNVGLEFRLQAVESRWLLNTFEVELLRSEMVGERVTALFVLLAAVFRERTYADADVHTAVAFHKPVQLVETPHRQR